MRSSQQANDENARHVSRRNIASSRYFHCGVAVLSRICLLFASRVHCLSVSLSLCALGQSIVMAARLAGASTGGVGVWRRLLQLGAPAHVVRGLAIQADPAVHELTITENCAKVSLARSLIRAFSRGSH